MKETVSDEAREVQGWGSSLQRQGAAYRKQRLVIFKQDLVSGGARVTIDEERTRATG